jgi:hypothetical protein
MWRIQMAVTEIVHALVLGRRACCSFVFEQRLGQLLRGEELLALRIYCSGHAPLQPRMLLQQVQIEISESGARNGLAIG